MMQVLIAFDQLINAMLGGMADETLSARAHRQHRRGNSLARNLINAIFFWQRDHCGESFASEFARKHLPRTYSVELPPDDSRI